MTTTPCPTTEGSGASAVIVVVVFAFTTKVPVFDAVPLWQVPPPLPASTVNVTVPTGVAAVVVIVKVDVTSPPVLVRELGLNEALTPAGRAEETLRGEVQELPFPLKFTVTLYVAVFPGDIGLGACAPTVTVLGFESENFACAVQFEMGPVAVAKKFIPISPVSV